MAPLMAMALFHSWPWRIPLMAMAHSIHGHGAFHSWPWPYSIHGHGAFHTWPWPYSIHGQVPAFMAKALSLSHHITAPGTTSPYIRCRIARASPPRRFRANRLNPGIKSCLRWGWFRGVAAVDRGDHGTSYIRICIGHKWGMRASMGARMAIYAHIYGSSNGHVCAYLWGHVYAYIYSSSNGHVNK